MNATQPGMAAIALVLLLAAMTIDAFRPHYADRPAGRVRVFPERHVYVPRRLHTGLGKVLLTPAKRITGRYAQPMPQSRLPQTRLQPRLHQTRPQQNMPLVNFRTLPDEPTKCPTIRNPYIRHVMTAAVGQMNRGSTAPHIARNLAHGGVERCKICASGRCSFDHRKVTIIAIMAPLCKSGNCFCGVERYGRRRFCQISGWTKPRRPAYNIEIVCDGVKIFPEKKTIFKTPEIQVTPATRLPHRPPDRFRPTATRQRTTTTAAATATTTLKPTIEQEYFDVSGDGAISAVRPAPIVEWDEVTSKATVVYPKPIISDKVNLDIDDEGLIQKAR